MKTRSFFTAILCCLFVGTFSLAAGAAEVTVDCDNGGSLNGALYTLDPIGAHHIAVTGTCAENIIISNLAHVTIEGSPSASIVNAATPAQNVVHIQGSRDIVLRNLTISGGANGVVIWRGSEVSLEGCTLENNERRGVHVSDSSTLILGGGAPEQAVTIRNNPTQGIHVENSLVKLNGYVTIENNGATGLRVIGGQAYLWGYPGENIIRNNGNPGVGLGINAREGSSLHIYYGTRVENNRDGGIQVANSSAFLQSDPDSPIRVENNGYHGMLVEGASYAWLYGPVMIRYNGNLAQGPGIKVAHNASLLAYYGVEISNNSGDGILADASATMQLVEATVTNNGGDGVKLLHLSVAESYAANSIFGNGGVGLSCDSTSLAYGDLGGISPIQCPGAEKGGGKGGGKKAAGAAIKE